MIDDRRTNEYGNIERERGTTEWDKEQMGAERDYRLVGRS